MPYIYGLVDESEPNSIRYIGKTARRVCDRLWDHKKHAKRYQNRTHRNAWINSVDRAGGRVVAVVLEECSEDLLNDREVFWIAHYKAAGVKLTNHTDGGDGSTNMDEATKQKLREYRIGTNLSEETKEKISKAFMGRASPMKGRVHTEETKAKMKGRAKGIPRPPEVVERMARGQAAKRGKLTEADARSIFQKCRDAHTSQSQIAKSFGVEVSTVERIYAGKTWKFLNLRGDAVCL